MDLDLLQGVLGVQGHVFHGGLLLGARGRVRVHVHGQIHKHLRKGGGDDEGTVSDLFR